MTSPISPQSSLLLVIDMQAKLVPAIANHEDLTEDA